MKRHTALFAIFALFLTACSSQSVKFSASDLKPELYQGYWAMQPINDIYRVIKFHPTGMVKIYDYDCDHAFQSYRLNETLTHYLTKIKANTFSLLDNHKKAFAQFEITRSNKNSLMAKQTFNDKKIESRSLHLVYQHQIGAKPLCGHF